MRVSDSCLPLVFCTWWLHVISHLPVDAFLGLQGRERFSLKAAVPPGRGWRRKTKHYLLSLQAAYLKRVSVKIKKLTGNLNKAKCVCVCV